MKTQNSKRLLSLLIVAAMLCASLSALVSINPSLAYAEDNVLYSEDFSGPVDSSLQDYLVVDNGVAKITGNMFSLPVENFVDSNNYILSFDLKALSESELYIHFVGLNGTTGENIYWAEVGNGAYWRISDFEGHDVYNNSGDLHGGLNGMPVDLSQTVRVKLVHFNGYVELYINGTRTIVSHLSDLGNNNYCVNGRTSIEEGTITGFAFHAANANAITIDNIVIEEALGLETSYRETNSSTSLSSAKQFDLSAQNLYKENFRVTGTFVLADDTKTDYFPAIKLFGLNNSIKEQNGREYAVNFQSFGDGVYMTPGIYWQLDGSDPWAGLGGVAQEFEQGDEIKYIIEVYGDNVDFYINDVLVISTTFTDMGIEKGYLQYIKIVSGAGGVYWKEFSYNGFDTECSSIISTEKTLVAEGADVTVAAEIFGRTDEDFTWYVNDIAQTETSRELNLNGLAIGEYTIRYDSDTIESNVIVLSVVSKMIVISADKLTGYPTDNFTIEGSLVGDFGEDELVWYINDVAQTQTEATLELSSLAAGTYNVKLVCGETQSNIVKITVNQGKISISSEKYGYFKTEKAKVTAALKGISETSEISWYINGALVSGENTSELEINLTSYTQGQVLSVQAKTDAVESSVISLYVVYDVNATIRGNADFYTVHTEDIDPDKNYDTFKAMTDASGNYLYTEKDGGDSHYTLSGSKPTSTSFILEYKLFVPADISKTYYVYPVMKGLNSTFPGGFVETALNVNSDGIECYVKDQSTSKIYNEDNCGLGKDLSYEGTISKKGEWNTVTVAVSGQNITMYINGELVLFFNMQTATVPTEYAFNVYPDGGTGVVPLRIKDINLYGIKAVVPPLSSVSLSVSAITAEIGETVTVTANLNPHNAEAEEIKWYINGSQVTGDALTYNFSSDTAGTYTIKCVIDGISASKTITVTGEEEPSNLIWIIVGCVGGVLILGGGIALFIVLRKKNNSK